MSLLIQNKIKLLLKQILKLIIFGKQFKKKSKNKS